MNKLLCAALASAFAFAVFTPTPASAQNGSFNNFHSALTVIGGIADRGFFAQPNAVDLSSVTCTLSGPPNTTDPDCSNSPPFNVTDSAISFKPMGPFSLSQLSKLSAPSTSTVPTVAAARRGSRSISQGVIF
jgi:hypothetical protein